MVAASCRGGLQSRPRKRGSPPDNGYPESDFLCWTDATSRYYARLIGDWRTGGEIRP